MKARRRVIGLHAAEAALEHGADKILAVWIDSQRNDVRLMALVDRLSALGLKSQPTQRLRLEQISHDLHDAMVGKAADFLLAEPVAAERIR